MPLVAGAHRVAGDQLLARRGCVEAGEVIGVDIDRGRDNLQRRRRRYGGLGLDDEEVVATAEDQENDEDDREQAASASATEAGSTGLDGRRERRADRPCRWSDCQRREEYRYAVLKSITSRGGSESVKALKQTGFVKPRPQDI